MAEIKIAPLVIDAPDCIPRIRALADRERSDELLGCVESVRVALAEGRAQFPIYASFPDPPDVELTCNQGTLVIEVSRVTWQRQSQVLAEADDRWPESLVELSPELMVNSKVRRAKRVLKGKRSGDYRTIKLRGERFDGPGFIGDDPLRATIDALCTAIKRKKSRLNAYSVSSPNVWLFLIDDGYPGAWADLLGRTRYRKEIAVQIAGSGFERIYLYRFSEGIPIRLH